jgi:hypothetical protein
MDQDLDALDRACAEAQGWTLSPIPETFGCGCPPGKDAADEDRWCYIPSPTRNPADFVALLEFHAKARRTCYLTFSSKQGEWGAFLRWNGKYPSGGKKREWREAFDPFPMVALCLATKAWSDARASK